MASAQSDLARFQLWRGVAGLVRRAAAATGLLLAFEDVLSNRPITRPLALLVLRGPRAALEPRAADRHLSRREARLDPEAGELIAKIGREGITLGLSRLDRQAASDLLRQRSASALPPHVAGRMFDSTQGSPLFLEEMLRLYAEEGAESRSTPAWFPVAFVM